MNTYQRETAFKEGALQQQAESVARGISLGFRKAVRERDVENNDKETLALVVQQALEDATVQAGVSGVYVLSESGTIIASAIGEGSAPRIVQLPKGFLDKGVQALKGSPFYFNTREVSGEENRYFILTVFNRGRSQRTTMHHNMGNNTSHHMQRKRVDRKTTYLLLDLNLGEFNSSFGSTKKQIFILSFVLLLVVGGSCLSFMALRSLTLSQRKLARLGIFQKQLLASLPIGLMAVSKSGFVKLINREMETIDPVFSQNALGKSESDINKNFGVELQHHLRNESRNVALNGEQKVLSFSKVVVLSDSGEPDGYVLLVEDVTRQHHLREELEKSNRMASLGKMAAGVAHELRNPLSSVKGLGVLLQSRFDKESTDYKTAGVLVAEVDRLNRSISELLDFAKPKNQPGNLFAIRNCVQKAVDLVAIDIEEMNVQLDVSLPQEYVKVRGDEDKLNQVFLNLLLNSIQAVEQFGAIAIRYTIEDNGEIVIEIKDDGAGIPEDILSQICDPYFTTKADGTGLGLAVSSKVVEDHGGTLYVGNHQDGGAFSKVTLPCVK